MRARMARAYRGGGAGATAAARVTRPAIPGELATDYGPLSPDALAGTPRRTIALIERELEDEPSMLTMRELVIADDDHTGPVVSVTGDGQTTCYRVAAVHFEDATTFFPVLGRHEVWQLISLTVDTPHPRVPRPIPDPVAMPHPLPDP